MEGNRPRNIAVHDRKKSVHFVSDEKLTRPHRALNKTHFLFEIVDEFRGQALYPVSIDRHAFENIVAQYRRRPDAKLRGFFGIDAVADLDVASASPKTTKTLSKFYFVGITYSLILLFLH